MNGIFRGLTFFLLFSAVAHASVPPRPEFGVLDSAALLPLPISKAIERVLSQHEQLTDERLSIYAVDGIMKGELGALADTVFEEWRKEAPRPADSVALIVNADAGEIEIRTGLGLDPVLPTSRIAEIRKSFFRPEWRAGRKTRAIVLSLVEVLRTLDSPLIASGEAVDTFERAGFTGGWTPAPPEGKPWMGWLLALVGIAATAFVLARTLVGEVHYTSSGWFRIPAAHNFRRFFRFRKKLPALVTGGGVSGKY